MDVVPPRPGTAGPVHTYDTSKAVKTLVDDIVLDGTFAQNPEALYRKLRTESPVCEVRLPDGTRGWLVTRYADAMTLLKDPRMTKNAARALSQYSTDRVRPQTSPLFNGMLWQDPPEHTRLRKLIVQAFTARAVARMQSIVDAVAEELLDAIDSRGTAEPVDLMADYAEPLPMRIIGELLGLPVEYAQPLRSAAVPLLSNATIDEQADAERRILEILSQLIEQKARQPGEDLLSALINASVDGSVVSQDELLAMCFLLIAAGHETTVNLIGNGVLALLNNPVQLQKLRANPELTTQAVEEMLRFDGPINIATMRFTTAEIDVDGVVIPPNQQVWIALWSANGDPARFPDAERFDVDRNTQGHLAFGHGIHYCIGAPLARMEGVTAIRKLLDRYDDITLDHAQELTFHDGIGIHGVKSLKVWLRATHLTGDSSDLGPH